MCKPTTLSVVLAGMIWASSPAAPAWSEPPALPASANAGKHDQAVKQITPTGVVTFDERKLAHISVRLPGKVASSSCTSHFPASGSGAATPRRS